MKSEFIQRRYYTVDVVINLNVEYGGRRKILNFNTLDDAKRVAGLARAFIYEKAKEFHGLKK